LENQETDAIDDKTSSLEDTPAEPVEEETKIDETTGEKKELNDEINEQKVKKDEKSDVHKQKLKNLFSSIFTKESSLNSKSTDSADSLFETLKMYTQSLKVEEENIEGLELSTNILSYERFYPGRILGNTFMLKNTSSRAINFVVSFGSTGIDRLYVGEKLCEYYSCDNINEIEECYTKHLMSEIELSEESLKPWHVEDPYTKRLSKQVEMELDPGESYEFIVVLKSPVVNKQTLFATNVVVDNITQNSVLKVFCFGCMETLRLSCPKEMYNKKLDAKLVKVVSRKKQAMTQIKVLLENKSDMPVCANFQSIEMEKNLLFSIPRDKLKIEPRSKALLEIKAFRRNHNSESGDKPEVIHKLVVAKIKDCEFKFSLIFEVTFI
jgi:hypothetical protein